MKNAYSFHTLTVFPLRLGVNNHHVRENLYKPFTYNHLLPKVTKIGHHSTNDDTGYSTKTRHGVVLPGSYPMDPIIT